MKKDVVWLKEQLNFYKEAVGNRYVNDYSEGLISAYKTVDNLVDQMDKSELPLIPLFVANWIVLGKEIGLTLVGIMDFDIITVYKTYPNIEFQNLKEYMRYGNTQKIVARAWLDGYKIEEITE